MSSLEEKFMPFRNKINNIITDLLVDGTYEDMMGLQDTTLCSDITILLEDELDDKFNKVELNDLSVKVLGKQTRCSTKECKELEETKMGRKNRSKKDICHDLAIFYVRIFNIISAILTAVDFNNNMCILRLRALFERTDGNVGKVSVCQANQKLYPSSFIKVQGMPYLLKLYQMYDSPESIKNNEAKKREIDVLQMNIKKFFKQQGTDYQAENVNQVSTNNQVLSSSIRNKIEKIESNMKGVKQGLTNMKDVFQKKGMINNTNIQRLNFNKNPSSNNNNVSSNTQQGVSNEVIKTQANSNNSSSNTKPSNNNSTDNTKPSNNNSTNDTKPSNNNSNNNSNNRSLNNEEMNVVSTNINEISGNNEEKLVNQKGGKTSKKKSRRPRKKSSKKSKKNKLARKNQKGGASFIKNILKKLIFTGQPAVKEDANNVVVNTRIKNMKNISDLEKIMSKTRVPESKIISGSNVKIGYVPTDLSKTPECSSGKLNTTVNLTDSKMAGFAQKYQQFEQHYYSQALDLINFLESNVLKQSKKGKYIIKKFNVTQLDEIEKSTRQKLLVYYEKCQGLFTESFFELVKVLVNRDEINKEANNNNEINEEAVEVNNL